MRASRTGEKRESKTSLVGESVPLRYNREIRHPICAKEEKIMFILVIGGSDVCKIPGLSAAGANPQVVPFTAPADADMLRWGHPRIVDVVPVDPQGHPTPAVITRASILEGDIPHLTLRAGSYLPPACPHLDLCVEPGKNPAEETAVSQGRALFEEARNLAEVFAEMREPLVIGESVPGGTTTAYMVLRALGIDGMVSSASPNNPVNLKESLCAQAFRRMGREPGEFRGKGLDAAVAFGDPMQIAVAGLVAGLPEEHEVVLAGGTQMLAVAAILRNLGVTRPLLVATTKYVAQDPAADFTALAAETEVDVYAAPLDFSRSAYQGLRDYEKGFVKEGVGAGGSVWYAERRGVSVGRVVARVEALYAEMMARKG